MKAKSQMLLGVTTAMLLITNAAGARDKPRERGNHPPRATQPHTRTTERQRTESGHTRRDTWGGNGQTTTRDAVVTNDREAGTRTRNVDYTGPAGNTTSVDTVRTKTDDGFTRSATVTKPQGETATRDLTVTRDKESDTVTREANYSADGRGGSMSDVIQRTDAGFSRETTRTTPNGETHTRSVDMSCDKDVGKCVKQVETGKQP